MKNHLANVAAHLQLLVSPMGKSPYTHEEALKEITQGIIQVEPILTAFAGASELDSKPAYEEQRGNAAHLSGLLRHWLGLMPQEKKDKSLKDLFAGQPFTARPYVNSRKEETDKWEVLGPDGDVLGLPMTEGEAVDTLAWLNLGYEYGRQAKGGQ
jgi:hypothetical protein